MRVPVRLLNYCLCTLFALNGCTVQGNAPKGNPRDGVFTILDGKVKVTAEYDTTSWEFNILITSGADTFKQISLPMFFLDDSSMIPATVKKMKKTTGWKGNYLFVRSECGGGNAWNCDHDGVYKIKDGRLLFIGNLTTNREEEIGTNYDGTYFRYLYDKFENNDLTSHAGAPGMTLILREQADRFVVDIEKTWNENLEYYRAVDNEITELMSRGANESDAIFLREKLLSNAVIAKYCGRDNEADQYFAAAKARLDRTAFSQFANILSQVKPGEY